MPRHKLTDTRVRSDSAARLQALLLAYHDFRPVREQAIKCTPLDALCAWQTTRLKRTHADLYATPRYHAGLDFLLQDLYAPQQFTRRDDDVERIFPTMVKLLPDTVLATVANLVELNLLTQQLDLALAETLRQVDDNPEITPERYTQAYRANASYHERRRQIQLIADIGDDLDRYVRSRTLAFLLKMTQGAAEMAGVGDLHAFLRRGFEAFLQMDGVEELLDRVVVRESDILEKMINGSPTPFD